MDGYNIIFAWEELSELAKVNIDGARYRLMDILCNYQGYKKDVYKRQGVYAVPGQKEDPGPCGRQSFWLYRG